jgi:hypothetical protein
VSDQQKLVKLTELWERTSARGQLLLFHGGERDRPTRPEKVHVWRLLVAERDPARRAAPQAAGKELQESS